MQSTRVKAPELSSATGWLNTDRPLSLEELRGKIVLLDFWTFCCVDCMHMLPYLKELERRYADELVVIGVHSAKFSNEKDQEQLRRAVSRYGIAHPVANDARFALWESFWVREWPTLILIDPEGYIVQRVACSEKPYGKFEASIEALIDEFDRKGTLDRSRFTPARPEAADDTGLLRYPGKVTADNKHLYVSDSGHNRIIKMTHGGEVVATIGGPSEGHIDGTYETARFANPQGLALRDGRLYVADTDNHLLREIDLESSTVRTIAGTGKQALFNEQALASGNALSVDLSSPWDLVWLDDLLYVCMAGPHQISVFDPASNTIKVHAGSGKESLVDGSLKEAQFAQPSGITTDGQKLWVVDAETSSVRSVETASEGSVRTIVGEGLFHFGDRDGPAKQALLQHPLGIAWLNSKLYICDSYNHKIKVVDPLDGSVSTLAGGRAGHEDGARAEFAEPGGICVADSRLFVADTNNHSLRAIDPRTGIAATIAGQRSHAIAANGGGFYPNLKQFEAKSITLRADSEETFRLIVKLPQGCHLNEDAPLSAEAALNGSPLSAVSTTELLSAHEAQTLQVETRFKTPPPVSGQSEMAIFLQVVYCSEGNASACHVATIGWKIPTHVAHDANQSIIELDAQIG